MGRKQKYAVHKDKSYGNAIMWTVFTVQTYFLNYNFISVEVAMKLFGRACPNTFSSLSSTSHFEPTDEKKLLPRKLLKYTNEEWENDIVPSIEDILQNKANRKWARNLSPEKVFEECYTPNKEHFDDWCKNQYWNNIKDVIKYGTADEKKEYWEFMTTLRDRIALASDFFEKTAEILENAIGGIQ